MKKINILYTIAALLGVLLAHISWHGLPWEWEEKIERWEVAPSEIAKIERNKLYDFCSEPYPIPEGYYLFKDVIWSDGMRVGATGVTPKEPNPKTEYVVDCYKKNLKWK